MTSHSKAVYGSGPLSPPLAQLADYSERISDLCDLLETIADDLPQQVYSKWRQAIMVSLVTVPQYYRMITSTLLPLLIKKQDVDSDTLQFLRQLHVDYLEGEASVSELQALLSDASPLTRDVSSFDALGYALRSFFSPMQRQARWEREVLLPFAARHLMPDDLEKISHALKGLNITQHPSALRL